jgi:sulfur carrier protein
VTLTVNGRARVVDGPATVAAVVAELTGSAEPVRGVAVAVNGAVVPRAAWAATSLRDGDAVEVLTAVQGG